MKGNTGEYYVLAELSRRGWTAAPTARNTRAYDILARKGERQIAIRVKTKTADAQVFQWNAKTDGTIFQLLGVDDFCILVDIPRGHEEFPSLYIVPTNVIDAWLQKDFQDCIRTPGPRKTQRDPTDRRRILHLDDHDTRVGHGYRTKLGGYRSWKILE